MQQNVLNDNLNKVKEMLLDEDKLITYISVSKELCIHVNESKFLLSALITSIKQSQPNVKLYVNYIVSGITEDNNAHTLICTEEDAAKVRNSFFKLVFFDHIYSISKSILEFDKVSHLAVNKFDDIFLYNGLVKNSICSKYRSDEIGNLKSSSQNDPIIEHKPIRENQNFQIKNHVSKESSKSVNLEDNKHKIEIKKEKLSPKKDSIKTNPDKKNTSLKGIAGFFGKTNGSVNKKTEIENVSVKLKASAVKEEKLDVTEANVTASKNTFDNKKNSVKPKGELKNEEINKDLKANSLVANNSKKDLSVSITNSRSKSSSVNQIKKNPKVDSKRKRVLHVSDSESEDDPFESEIALDNHSDDEIPPTPSVNTVKITSGIVNPKKRRKLVDKTYTDDEGYILTKKVEVYESCSDNEEEPSKQINGQKPSVESVKKLVVSPNSKKNGTKDKKKVTPPQKGKQSTLMNFFKKA